MKTIVLSILFLLSLQRAAALNITQVTISSQVEKTINIRLTTEAVELYYFQSWQYFISDTTITIEACFIPGFGSTIAYLHNDFQIPIDTIKHQNYHLIVNAYYNSDTPENLQDSEEGIFSTPVTNVVLLTDGTLSNEVFFPNPTTGKLFFGERITILWIFDVNGKKTEHLAVENNIIDLSNKSEGLYIIGFIRKNKFKTFRVLLRK